MTNPEIVQPGDRPSFIEGWHSLTTHGQEFDIPYFTVQSLCRIVDLAQQAVDQLGQSYRDFKVGAAVLALDEPGNRSGIYFGGNFTPYPGARNCAEKRALFTVKSRGFTKALAIAVSGPAQIDASGIESPTLHPCFKCRELFVESDLVSPDTLIATATPSGDASELFTRDSLLALHETHQQQPFPVYHEMLPFYWEQILEFDAEDEKADLARLGKIAQGL